MRSYTAHELRRDWPDAADNDRVELPGTRRQAHDPALRPISVPHVHINAMTNTELADKSPPQSDPSQGCPSTHSSSSSSSSSASAMHSAGNSAESHGFPPQAVHAGTLIFSLAEDEVMAHQV